MDKNLKKFLKTRCQFHQHFYVRIFKQFLSAKKIKARNITIVKRVLPLWYKKCPHKMLMKFLKTRLRMSSKWQSAKNRMQSLKKKKFSLKNRFKVIQNFLKVQYYIIIILSFILIKVTNHEGI